MTDSEESKVTLVDLTATLLHQTEKAFFLQVDDKKGWVAKALVEWDNENVFTMPEWLAIEKEFV